MSHRVNSKGFTFIELLLTVALLSLIAGMGVPVYQSLQNRNNLSLAVQSYTDALRRSQVLARANEGDSVWGVHIATSTITVFQGASFASRDASFDELTEFPSNIVVTGVSENVFSKTFGEPSTTGTTTLTDSTGTVRTIGINEKGTITY